MADVKNYKILENKNFEVLTEEGFKDFKGLIIGKNKNKIKLRTKNGHELICTEKHKIMISKKDWKYAKDLKENDKIYKDEIVKISFFKDDDVVYELLEVEDTHTYYANGVLSHQCLILDEFAFIRPEIAHAFYEAVWPTISRSVSSKIIMSSTPNGTQGKFYEIYSKGSLGPDHKDWNGFYTSEIMWDEIPRYNEDGEIDYEGFKKKQIAGLGGDMNSWYQEYCCVFHEAGAAAINLSVLEEMKQKVKKPMYSFDDGDYLVWEEPIPGHIYTIGVDTSEGVGLDYSVAQIMDITDLKDIRQVAQYHSNMIQPYVFAEKLNRIARAWGNPFMAIERNGPGGQVIDALSEVHHYDNIIHYTMRNDGRGMYQKLGVFCHTNSKYTGIMNMKYWIDNLRAVTVYDISTLREYETFRRKDNGTWCAQDGYFDDKVMSMVWALIPLETEIAQRYFSILQYDDVGKPKVIQDVRGEFEKYMGPLWDDSQTTAGLHDPSPSFLGISPNEWNQSPQQKDMLDMGVRGWTIL